MSRLPRVLNTLFRPSQSSLKTSVLAPPRTRSAQASFSTSHSDDSRMTLPGDDSRFAAHLHSVFPSLTFPPELAKRILTHGSHKAAIHGHNGRMGFIGRRVLESYFLLFVNQASHGRTDHDYDRLVSRVLNTYLLGEHVAPQWSLGSVLLWVPTVSKETLESARLLNPNSELDGALEATPGVAKSVGLYKVMGEAVQAVVGGVYHQYGGSVAHRLFHTRVLPHILLPERSSGVPDEFHDTALRICERMGGTESDLLHGLNSPTHAEFEPADISPSPKRKVAAAGL